MTKSTTEEETESHPEQIPLTNKTLNPPVAKVETLPDDIEEVSDPDFDDLDDLDDVLDQFKSIKIESASPVTDKQPTVNISAHPLASTNPPTNNTADDDQDDDNTPFDQHAFADQLQKDMAKVLGDLGSTTGLPPGFEDMMKELGVAPAPELSASTKTKSTTKPNSNQSRTRTDSSSQKTKISPEDQFQKQVRQTMERLQTSSDIANQDAAGEEADEAELIAAMMRAISSGGAGGVEGSEDQLSSFFTGAMQQLTEKETLYEPMKDLDDKFPAWKKKNKGNLNAKDLAQYELQEKAVRVIVEIFEKKDYNDDNVAYREIILKKMTEMQEAGPLPPDLVGDTDSAQDAMSELAQGCATQ